MSGAIKKNVTIRTDATSIERWRSIAASDGQSLNAWIEKILNAEVNIEDNYERILVIVPLLENYQDVLEQECVFQEVLAKNGFQMWNATDIDGRRHLRFVKRRG